MENYEYYYLEYLLNLHKTSIALQKKLDKYPEGQIEVHTIKRHEALYLHVYQEGKKTVKYLSETKNKELIEKYKRKKAEAPEIKRQINFCNRVIKRNRAEVEKILRLSTLPERDFPATPSQNHKKTDYLTIKTNRGEMVRSKSEKIIADTLYTHKIDYRYEQKLVLGKAAIHPDFTIINPLNGKEYYWEHLGLADDPNYLVDWFDRKALYNQYKIQEGKNLITTTEKDINEINEMIEEYFTDKRYKAIRKQEKPSG